MNLFKKELNGEGEDRSSTRWLIPQTAVLVGLTELHAGARGVRPSCPALRHLSSSWMGRGAVGPVGAVLQAVTSPLGASVLALLPSLREDHLETAVPRVIKCHLVT